MIGLDANVLVRYLMADEPHQGEQARAALESLTTEDPGYVNLAVLLETMWVLKRYFRVSGESIVSTVAGLLEVPTLKFQCDDDIRQAVRISQQFGHELPDCLIARLNTSAGCTKTVTFDRRATRLPTMTLIDDSS